MKKQLIFCLAFLGLFVSSCVEKGEHVPFNDAIPVIESVYPEFAVKGSEIIIAGQNFGSSMSDNFVTISGNYLEVTHVEPGRRIVAIVPKYLSAGEHTLTLFSKGQSCTKKCVIVESN